MGRGKLTLELIEKEKARMITYQKRKRGLRKKAQEFATLCGVPTCMIIYGPRVNSRPGFADVEVWPKDHKEFMQVVNLYRDKAFSSARGVKSQNLYDFFADRYRKVYEKIVKIRKANFESKFSSDLDEDFNNLSMHQLKETLVVLDNNTDIATRKLALIKGHHQNFGCNNNNNNNANNSAQVLFQQPQPLASHHVNMMASYHHHEPLQMVPFDFNPVDNPTMMMMLMNGGDQIQLGRNTTAQYNHHHHPMQHAVYCDPVGAMIENRVMMNNPRAAVRFVGSTMQQFQPFTEKFPAFPIIASQMHGSQFNGFYGDINEFLHKKEKL